MRVLALDSAFGPLSAATVEGDRIIRSSNGAADAKAAESLPALVGQVLSDSSWRIADLDRIAVTLGPGGFTSLRAGLAFAKGLALAAAKPLLGFTTLEALAVSAPKDTLPIAAVIDAKRDELFCQIFAPDGSPLCAPGVIPLNDLSDALQWPTHLRACGSGAAILAGRLAVRVDVLALTAPDAAALALHAQKFELPARPADAVYLRPADARPMA